LDICDLVFGNGAFLRLFDSVNSRDGINDCTGVLFCPCRIVTQGSDTVGLGIDSQTVEISTLEIGQSKQS